MLDALAEHFPPRRRGRGREGGLFIWATLPDYIDTTDLLARALRENVAFVPGRAAYLDGRGGSSMRLNFSGVNEDDIREGVRRIGKVVGEQVALYGTLTGARAGEARGPRGRGAGRRRSRRTCSPLRRGARGSEPRRACSRAAARSSARSRCARARRSRTRWSGSATTWSRSTSAPTSSTGSRRRARTSRSSRCTAAAARTAPSRSCSSSSALPYTGSGPAACIRCMDKVVAKHAMRDAGIPTPDFYSFSETAFRELGAAKALPAIEARLEFPIVVKPAGQGSALGIKFAATAADVPGALVAAFSYDTRVILERHVAGRDLAVSVIDGPDGPEALPLVEAIPHDEDFYDFEARYEIGRTDFRCPAELGDVATARRRSWRSRSTGCSAATASPAST